ncbi:MAG: saccharopine dehydrogenase [Bacteroidetes bacterium]|nr:MAG: saccharopine dehydrogenase [Bacteroidota bacterium]RLD83196.1 MAG: saccharopine dehydrogenase [Bacteroidota bacterium]
MEKKKVIILGAGLVGRPMALDLFGDGTYKIAVADLSKQALDQIEESGILKIRTDLSEENELKALVTDYDLIVNAVPGSLGYRTLKWCVEEGKDVVDIAFYPEDPLEFDKLAKEKNVRVICDMGVAPGMSNLLAGYAVSQLDEVEKIAIYVGGLPKVRTKPWEYKAVFSPADVIEEYTRPARLIESGEIVTKPPLTEIELLEFDRIGTLEAFNSDGLRSLMFTLKAKHMKEKTLRYPGYAEKIRLLSDNGFFEKEEIEINGRQVSPLEMTSKLLFDQWKLQPGEVDLTVMRIIVEGKHEKGNARYTFDLHDEYDPKSNIHSMARTTGYSATMAVRMLLKDIYTTPGITVPEYLGKNRQIVDFILDGLKERGIVYKMRLEKI